MRTLKFLLYKYENKPAFRKAVLTEILWALSYSILGYIFHHCLDSSFLVAQWLERWCSGIVTRVQFLRDLVNSQINQGVTQSRCRHQPRVCVLSEIKPEYWIVFNCVFILWIYLKNYTKSIGLRPAMDEYIKDYIITLIFQCVAYYLYPYLVLYPYWWILWWLLHIIYLYFMEDLFYILLHQHSPVLLLAIYFIGRVISAEEIWWDTVLSEFKDDTMLERIKEAEIKIKQEELKQSLVEESKKLKQWEKLFDKWSSSKAKEIAKIVSEENRAEVQMTSYSRQREKVREEIARLEIEQEGLSKKIVELDREKNNLTNKRHMIETQTEKKLFQQKHEKAKILEKIKKIENELNLVQDDKEITVAGDTDKADIIAKRTQQIATEIEEKERDLECPVCFEICSPPIFMCHLSHQICKQCCPKVKVCPQCRQPYRRHRQRHKVKEKTSNQLQILYKNMKELLENG